MIYASVSDELKNKYLKENGITAELVMDEQKEPGTASCYPGLDFLGRI